MEGKGQGDGSEGRRRRKKKPVVDGRRNEGREGESGEVPLGSESIRLPGPLRIKNRCVGQARRHNELVPVSLYLGKQLRLWIQSLDLTLQGGWYVNQTILNQHEHAFVGMYWDLATPQDHAYYERRPSAPYDSPHIRMYFKWRESLPIISYHIIYEQYTNVQSTARSLWSRWVIFTF